MPDFEIDIIANPDVLDKLIEWKLRSPRHLRKSRKLSAILEGDHMQRQITIELRVDYADNDKNETMRVAVAQAARHVYATAVLLADGIKPQVVAFSDDFFTGHEEIKLLDDVIQHGIDETDMQGTEEQVSPDLMAAMKDI